ncbi:hypothetical protein CR513_15287, partial [Mucuna pruriens]
MKTNEFIPPGHSSLVTQLNSNLDLHSLDQPSIIEASCTTKQWSENEEGELQNHKMEGDVITSIAKSLKNPRSVVCKTAIMTSTDIFSAYNDLIIDYLDPLEDGCVHDYMSSLLDINAKMRSILVDWLIEVHRKFELMVETLYLTLNIVVPRKELQLVGLSSMLLASKYEEIWALKVNDFVCISNNAYVSEQVLMMEKMILRKLE